jgi:hypothetical protein
MISRNHASASRTFLFLVSLSLVPSNSAIWTHFRWCMSLQEFARARTRWIARSPTVGILNRSDPGTWSIMVSDLNSGTVEFTPDRAPGNSPSLCGVGAISFKTPARPSLTASPRALSTPVTSM